MTAAITNRSSILPSVEAEDAQPAAPAKTSTPSADGGNRVQAFAGQALKGAPNREAVLAQVDAKMKLGVWGGVRDWFVTEKASRDSVELLGQLGAGEYRKAVAEMKPATMKALLTNMDADTRASFFRQAQAKGVVVEEPAVAAPRTAGAPPDKPALMRNEPSLPTPLREAIHAENQARTTQYTKDFSAYVTRYSEAALDAKSPLALRQMGPPAREFVLAEGGVLSNDRIILEPLHQGASERVRAAKAANDRISDFAGRPRAGSFTVTAEAKFAAEAGGFGVESSAKLDVTDYGTVKTKHGNEGSVKVLPGVKVGVDAAGQGFTEYGSKYSHVRLENGKVVEMEGFGMVKLTDEKSTFSTKAFGPAGTWATIDDKHGSYGGGVKVGSDLDVGFAKVEASVKLGVMVQGVSPERLPAIGCMRDDGIWGPMPELARTKWHEIPDERRARLASDGWTQGNWPVK